MWCASLIYAADASGRRMLAANYNTRAAFISAAVIIVVIIVVIADVFEIIIVVFGTIISSIVMNAAP